MTKLSTPTGLSSTGVDHDSGTANWGAVANASGYTLRYRLASSASWTNVDITSGSTTSYEITGLTADSPYRWEVRAEGTGAYSDSDYTFRQAFRTSALTKLGTPGSPASSSVDHDSATVSWSAVTNASSYTVEYWTGSNVRSSVNVSGTSANLTGLAASSSYNWRVKAEGTGAYSDGDYTARQTFSTSAAPPDGTRNNAFILTATGADTSVLSQVKTADRGDVTYFRYNNPAAGDWTMTFTTTPAQDWDVYFRAFDGTTEQEEDSDQSGNTPFTQSVTATAATDYLEIELQFWQSGATDPTAATVRLTEPITYTFSAYTDDEPAPGETITASFDGTAPTGITYQWQYRNSSNDAWANLSGQTSRTITLHARAPAGREYRICWTYGGTTYYATTYATVQTTPLTAPGSLASSDVDGSGASVRWGAVANASGYTVEYWTGSSPRQTMTVNVTSASLTGLTEGATYNWRVKAEGEGQYSDSPYSSASTFHTTRLATPGSLVTSSIVHDGATLTWGAVTNADRYTVQGRKGSGAWTTIGTPTTTTINATGLDPESDYTWRVRAEADDYRPSWYAVSPSFTTPATPPDGTQNLPFPLVLGSNNVLSSLRLDPPAPRPGVTFFRLTGLSPGEYTFVFATTPGQDFDTHLRAKNAAGTDLDTDSEAVDTTPHTLSVDATDETAYIELEIQDWAAASNPTAATVTVTFEAATTSKIYLGTGRVDKAYVGTTAVTAAYVGTVKVL